MLLKIYIIKTVILIFLRRVQCVHGKTNHVYSNKF